MGADHFFDRWARRSVTGRAEGVSRRRFLVAGSAAAAGVIWPTHLLRPGAANATTSRIAHASEAITSCDCSGYSNYVGSSCYNEVVGNAPADGEFAATEGIMYGIAIKGAQLECSPKEDAAKTACKEVPCPAGQRCNPASNIPGYEEPPTCIGCPSGQSFCGTECVDRQTDLNNCGSCGHVCVSPTTCQNGQCGCNTCGASGNNPYSKVCGGECVDTAGDPNNCGGCGNVCSDTADGFTGICNCGACSGCAGALGGFWCCQTGTCTHACPQPGETCP
jgi:hypothetical protein